MAGGRYEEVNGARKGSSCCLKLWLTFFVIATLALIGVVIWLVLSAKNGQSLYGYSAASSNELVAASGHPVPEICTLPAAPGPCRANIERYFYDSSTGSCNKFIYGGCSGNGNNFETLDDCVKICAPKPVKKPDFCMLEKDPGPCYAAFPRYAYDKKLEKCVEFTFGGCGGNRNNFESLDDCEKQCKEPNEIRDSLSENSGDTSVCFLPRETGNCRGYIQKWGFDPSLSKCVQFVYGGCGGNGNNFDSLEACEQRCQAYMAMSISSNELSGVDPVCKLPQDTGPCRGSIRRWAYDVSRSSCVEFTYGGCQGNPNNFETREACEAKCSTFSPKSAIVPILSGGKNSNPICELPQDAGPCRALIPRWAFDVSKGQCVQFTYGGCRGNENNFETKQQCEAACGAELVRNEIIDTSVCHLPREAGNCRGYFKRWGFDPSSGQCVQFVYGGCGGNSNNFETNEACEQRCRAAMPVPLGNNDNLNDIDPVCKLSKDPGPCRGLMSRWAFDLQKGECIEFFYGGCQGNDNNFETKEACEAKCSLSNVPMIQQITNSVQTASNNVQQIPVCQLPHERGECMAYIPRWGFDPRSGKCVQFVYGGCGGNDNNFETQEDCEKKCKAVISMSLPATSSNSIDPVCKLPKEVGPCRGSNKRWAFDFSKGICEEFIYGGCRGNANNFESKEDCEARCGSFNGNTEGRRVGFSVCHLPHERGNCRETMQRWGYDQKSGKCIQFIYGGCGGNANNFETKETCEQKCSSSYSSQTSTSNNGALDSVCLLPQDTGPCRSSIKRWSYDVSKRSCVQFTYGGCRGNDNNFETKEACEAKCEGSPKSGESGESSGQVVDISICHLPRERGNCLQYAQRWGYDPATRSCVQFVYGGCGGNENNFETQEACEKKCLLSNVKRPLSSSDLSAIPKSLPLPESGNLDQVCSLPTVVGPCRLSYRRWTYKASNGGCVEFFYGGCGGNANNFESREACEAKCGRNGGWETGSGPKLPVTESDNDVCFMPHARGDCYGFNERWGFEPKTGQCVMFIYGGCGGNDNNFESKEACELRCIPGASRTPKNGDSADPVCMLPKDTGPCRGSQRRWAYDTSADACVEFIYGGCRGNENNFESREACEARCGMKEYRNLENRQLIPQSANYHGKEENVQLIFRGGLSTEDAFSSYMVVANGNEDNFKTKEDCEERCPPIPSEETDALDPVCKLPQEIGPCRALVPRWTYDASQGRCIEFSYGGCRGNANNFNSKELCEAKCGTPIGADSSTDPLFSRTEESADTSICRLPRVRGNCMAHIQRWGFDPNIEKCVQFIYSGCGGNENNFETNEACEERCLGAISNAISANADDVMDPVCKLPQETGPCRASLRRWRFDMSKGECVQFTYGGCRGNSNNFESKEACEVKCIIVIPPPRAPPSIGSIAENSSNVDAPLCHLPLERGNCYAFIQRWGFDAESEECVQFVYGGCGGNSNNFKTKEACEQRCLANIPNTPPVDRTDTLNPICSLPKEVGPCRSMLRRWYFDAAVGKCTDFIYGGCQGNANNFETEGECAKACNAIEDYPSPEENNHIDLTDTSVCHLPHERGNCQASLQRWGFDVSGGRCVQFIYSGCGGNDNNFETREACEQRCLPNTPNARPADINDAVDPDCRLPMEVGPCRARFQRWYYDTSSGQCVEFYYGGCRGNANKFQSKEACEAKCMAASAHPPSSPVSVLEAVSSDSSICHLPHERGICKDYIQRWGFDASSGKCIQFVYGGCGGNVNNFETKAECEQRCLANIPMAKPADASDTLDSVCRLLREVGPCRAYMKRWFYDVSKAECVEFNYGGCRGNANNFETKEACEAKCYIGAHSVVPSVLKSQSIGGVSVCNLPHEQGNCYKFTHRWGYDPTYGKCIQFVYGGCGGNENNFETREECEQRCLAVSPNMGLISGERVADPICELPQDVGPCRAAQPRWSYDTSSKKCEEFIYGGCRGNANNFATKEACEAKCRKNPTGGYPQGPQGSPNNGSNPGNADTSVCHLTFEKGMCRAYFQRWGFDPNSGRCVQFIYGGCGGNANNFETKEACEQRCLTANPHTIPVDRKDALDPICSLPQDVSPCKAMQKRWSYDLSRDSCVKFYYGGCRGNANNFENREACEAKCGIPGAQPNLDICKLPRKEGPCRGRKLRFYYDSASEQCLEFYYGGCRGNDNNFFTKAECETRCAKAT